MYLLLGYGKWISKYKGKLKVRYNPVFELVRFAENNYRQGSSPDTESKEQKVSYNATLNLDQTDKEIVLRARKQL